MCIEMAEILNGKTYFGDSNNYTNIHKQSLNQVVVYVYYT